MPRLVAVVAVLCTTALVHAAGPSATPPPPPAIAPPEPMPRYDINVRVDAAARTASGHVRIEVPNGTGKALDELWLWRYPERFAVRSRALNDYNFYWVYPRKFNPGHMRTGAVVVDGRAAAVEVRDHARAGPGTLLHVALDP